MNHGGVLLSHDYINHEGVKKAFDEFFEKKQEPIIEMSGTQCLVNSKAVGLKPSVQEFHPRGFTRSKSEI